MNRPNLYKRISLKDFNDFYWLKKELMDFCRVIGISTSGGKMEIVDRIRSYLTTAKVLKVETKKRRVVCKLQTLSRKAIITGSYSNSEKARSFFIKEIGPHFAFNVIFMKWMKDNVGKNFEDAIVEWTRIYNLKKDKNYISEIGPQFEYNKYMREFFADNPESSRSEAIKCWRLKRSQRGSNEYDRRDLDLK